jgi:predicted amidohydrolase YtcJ
MIPTGDLARLIQGAGSAGLQVAVHAIGDKAVDEVIQAFVQAKALSFSSSSSSSTGGIKHRVEHVQHIAAPETAASMVALGLDGVPNPQHLLTDRPLLLSKLGFNRAGPGRAFAFKTLAQAGVKLGFGSDWPVVGIDPWTSVFAAVHRTDPPGLKQTAAVNGGYDVSLEDSSTGRSVNEGEGKSESERDKPWESDAERVTLSDALLGHTLLAAEISRLGHYVGKLAPRYKADFIVMDKSPFATADGAAADPAAETSSSSSSSGGEGLSGGLPCVMQTYMDGVCVYGCEKVTQL